MRTERCQNEERVQQASGLGREQRCTEIRNADDKVGNHKRRGAIKAVGALFDKCRAVLEECRHIGNSHKGHER